MTQHSDPSAARLRLRGFVLDAIRRYTEPSGLGEKVNFDIPVGIHVDEAEDIPDFLDSIISVFVVGEPQ